MKSKDKPDVFVWSSSVGWWRLAIMVLLVFLAECVLEFVAELFEFFLDHLGDVVDIGGFAHHLESFGDGLGGRDDGPDHHVDEEAGSTGEGQECKHNPHPDGSWIPK